MNCALDVYCLLIYSVLEEEYIWDLGRGDLGSINLLTEAELPAYTPNCWSVYLSLSWTC